MKEHPILFSGPMVRAILEGRKTQTRRVMRKQPVVALRVGHVPQFCSTGYPSDSRGYSSEQLAAFCPYGKRGERLWVRETWAIRDCGRGVSLAAETWPTSWPLRRLQYIATDKPPQPDYWWNSRPSTHMPRWASRITLEITNVRVERLQEISEADCVSEGIQVPVTTEGCPSGKARILTQLTGPGPHGAFAPCTYLPRGDDSLTAYSRAHFASLWDSINAKRGYSWKSNPWVWVVEFRKT